MSKDYGQFCGLARAASVIGERWSLLILRDVTIAPRRFGDLREGLPGIPTNVLTTRLRELESSGIVARQTVPLPAKGTVYALTSYGETLSPILDSLGRWGALRMHEPAEGEVVTDASLAAALRAGFRPGATASDWSCAVVAGEAKAWARVAGSSVTVGEGDMEAPDLVISGGAALRPLLAGELDPDLAIRRGEIEVSGDHSLLSQFIAVFQVPLESASESQGGLT